MKPNRIESMRVLANNLRSEGHASRADCVDELCDEIERAQSYNSIAMEKLTAAQAENAGLHDRYSGSLLFGKVAGCEVFEDGYAVKVHLTGSIPLSLKAIGQGAWIMGENKVRPDVLEKAN